MTARRKETVLFELLERGIPAQWASEEQAAALSGMHYKTFKEHKADLEARGFPKIDAFTGQRFIPAILDFWRRRAQAGSAAPTDEPRDEQSKEKWS